MMFCAGLPKRTSAYSVGPPLGEMGGYFVHKDALMTTVAGKLDPNTSDQHYVDVPLLPGAWDSILIVVDYEATHVAEFPVDMHPFQYFCITRISISVDPVTGPSGVGLDAELPWWGLDTNVASEVHAGAMITSQCNGRIFKWNIEVPNIYVYVETGNTMSTYSVVLSVPYVVYFRGSFW